MMQLPKTLKLEFSTFYYSQRTSSIGNVFTSNIQ